VRGAVVLAAGLGWLTAGCDRNGIQVYKVAKEAAPADPAPTQAGTPTLEYATPQGWESAPLGQMRVASFKVAAADGKQAEVSVIPLPGMAGGDLGNVNRWRDQVGLAPVAEADLTKLAEPVTICGESSQLYDQAGQNPASGEKTRILAALLRKDGVAWFFKMIGDDELVARQKPSFLAFLTSAKFAAGTGAPADAMTALPPSHPAIGTAVAPMAANGGAPAVGTRGDQPSWTVPTGWQEVPGGQFLVAKFTIAGDAGAQAAVNVSSSAGTGGGLAGNVARWRGQLGLAPLGEAELAKEVREIEVEGGKAMLVDMTGTDARTGQPARLIGAVVGRGDQTWFFKLMGEGALVGKQQAAFLTFLKGVKYPGGSGQ